MSRLAGLGVHAQVRHVDVRPCLARQLDHRRGRRLVQPRQGGGVVQLLPRVDRVLLLRRSPVPVEVADQLAHEQVDEGVPPELQRGRRQNLPPAAGDRRHPRPGPAHVDHHDRTAGRRGGGEEAQQFGPGDARDRLQDEVGDARGRRQSPGDGAVGVQPVRYRGVREDGSDVVRPAGRHGPVEDEDRLVTAGVSCRWAAPEDSGEGVRRGRTEEGLYPPTPVVRGQSPLEHLEGPRRFAPPGVVQPRLGRPADERLGPVGPGPHHRRRVPVPLPVDRHRGV